MPNIINFLKSRKGHKVEDGIKSHTKFSNFKYNKDIQIVKSQKLLNVLKFIDLFFTF